MLFPTKLPLRVPDFIIGGAMKCGTTSLLYNLREHPDIYCPKYELQFFDNTWENGWKWYSYHFSQTDAKLVGEKSPFYVTYNLCHRRIKTHLPNVKWLLVFRNPVDRWISHWKIACCTQIQVGQSFIPPETAFEYQLQEPKLRSIWEMTEEQREEEKERRRKAWSRKHLLPPDDSVPLLAFYRHDLKSALAFGCYDEQLKSLFKYFPRSQVHIGILERLSRNPGRYYRSVCDFLGIYYYKKLGREVHNVTQRSFEFPLSVRRMLRLYYQKHIDGMRELLNDDISEWNEPVPIM